MLEALGFILIIVAVAGVALAIFVATRPADFRVVRKAHIAASPAAVYDLIQDFRNWRSWSPWEELDPALKRRYAGAENGLGAVYEWEGNSKAGAGRMEIVRADAPSNLLVQLDFLKPFKARSNAEFTIAPDGSGVEVVWAMYGPNSLPGKVMSLFVSMDAMIGKSFEAGFAKMKAAAETPG